MNDQINVVNCPRCNTKYKVPSALMYVDIKKQFAVWWEPIYDDQIDIDSSAYGQMFGEGNFYQKAPRISDWNEFKNTINKFYRGELNANPIEVSPEQKKMFEGAAKKVLKDLEKQNKKGCSLIFLLIIGSVNQTLSGYNFL